MFIGGAQINVLYSKGNNVPVIYNTFIFWNPNSLSSHKFGESSYGSPIFGIIVEREHTSAFKTMQNFPVYEYKFNFVLFVDAALACNKALLHLAQKHLR